MMLFLWNHSRKWQAKKSAQSVSMNNILRLFTLLFFFSAQQVLAQDKVKLSNKDRKRDVEITCTAGVIVLRLNDSTAQHRDNFLRLVKSHYLDSTLFHRVINHFVIQAGDPDSRQAPPEKELGNGGPAYTIPAKFFPFLFHARGALGAARDDNPLKASSGSQFYIVQGKKYTDHSLDSLEKVTGRKIPDAQREVYKAIGGLPKLDQRYTVFGVVMKGMDVVDLIETVRTDSLDRPVEDVRIIHTRLVKRKKHEASPWAQ